MSAKPAKPPKAPKAKKGKDAAAAASGEGGEGAAGEHAEEGGGKKKMSGKTLILFIVLPVLLVVLGGGAAAVMFLGKKPPAEAHADAGHGAKDEHGKKDDHGKKKDAHGKKDSHGKDKKKDGGHGKGGGEAAPITEGPDGTAYYELPPILVNIHGNDDKPLYLKLKVSVEFADAAVAEELTPVMPRLTDQFQAFLRELRVDDISGSAGTYRLRMELLRRVNLALAPGQASAVLIEEMLVQ